MTAKVTDANGKDTGKTQELSGVTISAKNSHALTDISFGAGKAGNIGFEGLFAWLGGTSKNNINIDGAVLTSFGKGTKGKADKYGNVDILSQTDNTFTNLVGAIAWSSGGASVGASVGVLDAKNVNDIALKDTTVHAASFDANALTDGTMNNITVAGSMTTKKAAESTSKQPTEQIEHTEKETPEEKAAKEKIKQQAEAAQKQKEAAEIKGKDASQEARSDKKPPQTSDKPAEEPKKAPETTVVDEKPDGSVVIEKKEEEKKETPATGGSSGTKGFQLAAAGSASINVVNSETKATFDGGAIHLHDGIGQGSVAEDGHVNMKAEDGSYVGAYAGAAAINWQQGPIGQVTKEGEPSLLDSNIDPLAPPDEPMTQQTVVENADGSKTIYDGKDAKAAAALSGAVAMNVADQKVTSELSNVKIENAKTVQNIAQKDGAIVAAGLGLAASKNDGTAVDFTGAISFNEAKSDIDATIRKSDITAKNGVSNLAYDSDTEVAGGANMAFVKSGKTSVGVGASIAISDLHNDIDAMITGSTVKAENGTIMNHAAENLTQVGAAVGVAATTGGNTGVAVDATLASNNAENKLKATVSGGSTLTAKKVDNAAYDANDLAKPFDQIIENSGVNATGSTYLKNATDNAATHGDSDTSKDMTNRNYKDAVNLDNHGSTKQITGAFALTASEESSGVAGGAAAAIGTLRNDMEAGINNSTITADTVTSEASSDAVMFDGAAGVSLTNGSVGGAGSVSVQYTSDTTQASISNSTVTADDVTVQADSGNVDVNVAGQASYGQNGFGLAVAFNHLGNATNAKLLGSDVTAKTDKGVAVDVTAKNHDTVVSVGAGVSGGETAAVNGSIAINQGNDNAEALVDASTDTTGNKRRTSIKRARKLLAKADDSSTKVAVAGAINGAGTAAVGGAIAYNEIGTWEKNADNTYKNDREQQTHAALNNADVTTVGSGKDDGITVTASDVSTLGTAATALGGAGTAAVEGAVTTSIIARESYAEMTGTNIKKDETNGATKDVHVSSTGGGSTYNAAVIVAGSGTASVGAGIAVNYDNTDNTTHVAGGTIEAKNVRVDATTQDKILNVGLGGTGSAYAGVTGSLGVNILGGHTCATISDTALDGTKPGGAHITSDGNVIVAAQRDGSIDNLVGVAAGSGIGASVGGSVAVNVIANDVSANLDGADTSVIAKGGTAENVKDTLDGTTIDKYLDEHGNEAIQPAKYMTRKDSAYQGVAVSASSTNENHNWAFNLTAGGIGASVSGNIAVNTIGGRTDAHVSAGNVTADSDSDGTGDLHVVAHDYADNQAYTGMLAVNGVGGSVGVGTTTLTVSRGTSAKMTGDAASKAKAQANIIGLDADSQYGISNATVTGAVAAGAVANVDNVNVLHGTTTAEASGYDMTVGDGLAVSAKHGTKLRTVGIVGTAGAGAVGLGIDVASDTSKTTAELADGSVTTKENKKGDVTVAAESETHDNYKMVDLSGGVVGISTNVSVGNFNAQTTAHVADMKIGDTANRAGEVNIHAKNKTDVTADT